MTRKRLTSAEQLHQQKGVCWPSISYFRTKTWFNSILAGERLSREEFARCYSIDPRYVDRWELDGIIKRKTAHALCDDHSELTFYKWLFDLPLWGLLEDRWLAAKDLEPLLKHCCNIEGGEWRWQFPNDDLSLAEAIDPAAARYARWSEWNFPPWYFPKQRDGSIPEPLSPPTEWDDSDALSERGDIYGFIAILALVRDAEFRSDDAAFVYHLVNLYRAYYAATEQVIFHETDWILYRWIMHIHARNFEVQAYMQPTSDFAVRSLKEVIDDPYGIVAKCIEYERAKRKFRRKCFGQRYQQAGPCLPAELVSLNQQKRSFQPEYATAGAASKRPPKR